MTERLRDIKNKDTDLQRNKLTERQREIQIDGQRDRQRYRQTEIH